MMPTSDRPQAWAEPRRSRYRSGRILAGFLLCCGALAACEPASEQDGTRVSVADSAGVRIVHSEAPTWQADGSRWSIPDEPVLEIGAAEGDEAFVLHQVRAAVRLPGGRIAVANQGTTQIRVYEAGEHLREFGRSGDGPGEFRLLSDLWTSRGDSILAADNLQGRVTVYGPDGELARTIRLTRTGEERQLFPRGSFDDGTLLVARIMLPAEAPREGLFDGGSRVFHRYTPEGDPLERIGELRHPPNWGYPHPSGIAYTGAPFYAYPPPHASGGTSVYLGDGSGFRVEERSAEGELLRIIRWSGEARPVTSEAVERFRHLGLEGAETPEARRQAEARLEGMPYPEELPAFQSLLVDAEGHLWVERYRAPWEEARRWWVFAESGAWLGEPPVPPDLDIMEVGSDYILGVRRDEFDVERVVMYRLDRGS